jgi:hypothetical protein
MAVNPDPKETKSALTSKREEKDFLFQNPIVKKLEAKELKM